MGVSRKKILSFLLLVILVGVVGVAVTLYQRLSDLDEIRRVVVAKLEEITGRDVQVAGAELDFKKGLGLRLRKVTIGGKFRGKPRLAADSLWVVVKVLPLLKKQVEIRKLVLHGAQVQVVRDAAGQWNLHGLVDQFGKMAKPKKGGLLNMFKVRLIKRVVIQDARVQLFDFSAGADSDPVEMNFAGVQFSLRKDFFTPSYKFDARAQLPHPERPGAIRVAGKLLHMLSFHRGLAFTWEAQAEVEELRLADLHPYVRRWVPEVSAAGRLALSANFSGEWGGTARSAGTLRYTTRDQRRGKSLRAPSAPGQGVFEYDLSVDAERVMDLKAFRLLTGPFEMSGRARFSELHSKNPKIAFSLATHAFRVNESRGFFPLNVLFSEDVHALLRQRLPAGKLAIESLKFDGTFEELNHLADPKNYRRLSARIRLEDMDFASPLPEFKSVMGTIQLENGTQTLDLSRVVYSGFALFGVQGTIRNAVDEPVADLSLENSVDAGRLHATLMKLFEGDPFKGYIEDYEDLQGPARIRLRLKGPLKNPEELYLEAALGFDGVSLREKGFDPRIENLQGTLICVRSPASDKEPAPLLRFLNLSGKFGGSSFSRLNGEVRLAGDKPERTLSAFYTLASGELPAVLADLSLDPPFDAWSRRMTFNRGTVEVDYHSFGNPETPELEKEWGVITLRDLSMQVRDKAAAFHNLTGTMDFKDEGLSLQEVLGWFGDSPFHLEGTVLTPTGTPPEFSLHLITNSLKGTDLSLIPVLKALDYEGLAEVDLRVSGTERSFTFRSEMDLTRTAYQFGNGFYKKQGASQKLKLIGEYAEGQGVRFNTLDIVLGANRVTGHGRMKQLADPVFSVELVAKDFKLHPAGQYFSIFQHCQGGAMTFETKGEGKISRLEEAHFSGKAKVVQMQLKPNHFLNTLTLDTEVRFSGRKIEVSEGTLKSDRSNVRFMGAGELGSPLNLDLKLTGDRLVVDELLPEPDDKDVDFKTYMSDSPFFSRGTGRVKFALDRLNFKFLDLPNASGLFTLDGGELKVNTLDIGKDKEILVRGVVSLNNSEEGTLRGLIRANNTRAENFMGLFGGLFKDGLTGQLKKLDLRFQSNGRGMPTFEKTLEARWEFDIFNGTIDTGRLRKGAIELFGIDNATEGAGKEAALKPFTQIAGRFELANGIAETEKFVYETNDRRTSIVGKFDLVRHEMDLIAGVAPMAALDKFLTKIPVVGKIITGGDEESLVKAYFSVKGGFENPKVSAIPFTSLSRKVMGIFQGIFQSPGSLFPQTGDAGR